MIAHPRRGESSRVEADSSYLRSEEDMVSPQSSLNRGHNLIIAGVKNSQIVLQ